MSKSKTLVRNFIFERNPDSGVIRWRFEDESPYKFGWPNYGRLLNERLSNDSNNGTRSIVVNKLRKRAS